MRYEPAYDGLRAIAVFAVVIFHLAEFLLPGGWVGVEIFFVLSGYLITSILIKENESYGSIDFKRFYYFRVLRLAPALIAVLLFVFLVALKSSVHREAHLKSILAAFFYMTNWHEALGGWPMGLLAHTWSLSVEEQFYFLWPLLFLFFSRGNLSAWIAATIVLANIWRIYLEYNGAGWARIIRGFDTHCDALLLGCLLASCRNLVFEKICARFVMVPILGLVAFALMPFGSLVASLPFTAIVSGWLVISIGQSPRLRGFLSMPFLVYTGRISYGWYLWHFPIWHILDSNFSDARGWSYVLLNSIILVSSYAMAALSYRFLEKPFLALKKKYPSRRAVLVKVAAT